MSKFVKLVTQRSGRVLPAGYVDAHISSERLLAVDVDGNATVLFVGLDFDVNEYNSERGARGKEQDAKLNILPQLPSTPAKHHEFIVALQKAYEALLTGAAEAEQGAIARIERVMEGQEDKVDVDYTDPDKCRAEVFFNGRPVLFARKASIEQGWVDVLVASERVPTQEEGADSRTFATVVEPLFDRKGGILTARIFGDVTVKGFDKEGKPAAGPAPVEPDKQRTKLKADIFFRATLDGADLDNSLDTDGALPQILCSLLDLSVWGLNTDVGLQQAQVLHVQDKKFPYLLVYHGPELERGYEGWAEIEGLLKQLQADARGTTGAGA